CGNSMHNQQIE
ncbi:unnamed protein product, partial [Allacma fusca]